MYRYKSCKQTLFLWDTYWSQLCWGFRLPAPRLWAGQSGCHLPPCAGRMPSSRHAVGRHFCRQEGGEDVFVVFHRVNDEYRLRTLKRDNDENWLVMIYMGGLWWLACTWCILKCATDHCAVGNPTPKQACPQHISWPHILVPPALFLLLLVSLPPFRVLSLLVTTTTSDDRHYNFATLLKSIACFMLLRSLEHT